MLLELFCKEMLPAVAAPLRAGLALESRGWMQDSFIRTWVRLVVVTTWCL